MAIILRILRSLLILWDLPNNYSEAVLVLVPHFDAEPYHSAWYVAPAFESVANQVLGESLL